MTPDPRMDAVVRFGDLYQILAFLIPVHEGGVVMERDVRQMLGKIQRIAASRAGVEQGKPSGVEAAVASRTALDRALELLASWALRHDKNMPPSTTLRDLTRDFLIHAYDDAARTNTAGGGT